MRKILFRTDSNASMYEITMHFNYSEQKAGQEMKQKTVSRSFGPRTLIEYIPLIGSDDCYYLEYSVNWLFNALTDAIGGDTVHDANHPDVTRYIDDFVITISAAGEELTNYYLAHEAQANSPVSLISNYTNIEGAMACFHHVPGLKDRCISQPTPEKSYSAYHHGGLKSNNFKKIRCFLKNCYLCGF